MEAIRNLKFYSSVSKPTASQLSFQSFLQPLRRTRGSISRTGEILVLGHRARFTNVRNIHAALVIETRNSVAETLDAAPCSADFAISVFLLRQLAANLSVENDTGVNRHCVEAAETVMALSGVCHVDVGGLGLGRRKAGMGSTEQA